MATKSKAYKEKPPTDVAELAPTPEIPQSWWPEEFASPLTAALAAGFVFVWSVLLFVAGSFDGLLWFKRLQLSILGVYEPSQLAAETGSWDAVCVLWAFGAFFAAIVVHPSLALALLMLLRPWLDAYTYQTDNLYFTWAALLLMVIWGRTTRHKIPVFLFVAFFACILLSTYTSIHYNKSFRFAVFWAGDLALFISVLNFAQQRRIFNILLCAFMVTLATEVLYAIPHFKLLLPYLRKTLMEDPSWLMQNYGTTEMSPELARRFNINRAFGNMLFPNALAGFYILCLPPLLSLIWIGCARFKKLLAQAANLKTQNEQSAAVLFFSGMVFLVTCVTVFVEGMFASALGDPKDIAWYEGTAFIGFYSVTLGLIAVLAFYYFVRRGGLELALNAAWVVSTLLLLPALLYSLFTTYSRGAFLALFVAVVLGIILYFLPSAKLPKKLGKVLVAFLLTAILASSTFAFAQALAPAEGAGKGVPSSIAAPPAAPTTALPGQGEVSESGVDLSMDDLSDASTFKLRISYWRVGMRMLSDFWILGTGLGAFEMAYPKYQHIGDGEVREVHNSVLQMFIETGFLGGVFFALFWGFVLLWGLRRILHTHDKTEKLLLCGMYTGLLAFLGHSLLDIHFSHQGLIFFLLILTALFIARAAPSDAAPMITPRWVSILVLGFCTTASALGLQFYLHDYALNRGGMIDVANTKDIEFRMQVADYFYTKVHQYRLKREGAPPRLSYAAARALFPSHEMAEDCGEIFVPVEGGKGVRRLSPGEHPPFNAILSVSEPFNANRWSIESGEAWLLNWAYIDNSYPYDPRLATWIGRLYQRIGSITFMERFVGRRQEFIETARTWFEKALERNPMNTEMHLNFASILLSESKFYEGEQRNALLEQALSEARTASALSPISPDAAYALIWYVEMLAGHLEKQETGKARAAELRAEAQSLRKATALLIDKLVDVKRPMGQKKYSALN